MAVIIADAELQTSFLLGTGMYLVFYTTQMASGALKAVFDCYFYLFIDAD